MAKQAFETWNPSQKSLLLLIAVNKVLESYASRGFTLSLRQLYYQLVAADIIPNNQRSYSNLGTLVLRGRMAGYIDWDYIEDRHRRIMANGVWDSPTDIIEAAAKQYQLDRWEGQNYHVIVLVEKDALSSVVWPVCQQEQVKLLPCKGYLSGSTKHDLMELFVKEMRKGKKVVIIYLGDHDPSGLDMPRNIRDDMRKMCRAGVEVRRIALTKEQINQFNPPPNPAKMTDSRIGGYLEEHGDYSWELDALSPEFLQQLVRDNILALRDEEMYQERKAEEERNRSGIRRFIATWPTEDSQPPDGTTRSAFPSSKWDFNKYDKVMLDLITMAKDGYPMLSDLEEYNGDTFEVIAVATSNHNVHITPEGDGDRVFVVHFKYLILLPDEYKDEEE